MIRRAVAALSICTKVLAPMAIGRSGVSVVRGRFRRGAIRRFIRGFIAGLTGILAPQPEGVLVPVPVRVRSRRR
jgi:hypothetical protein